MPSNSAMCEVREATPQLNNRAELTKHGIVVPAIPLQYLRGVYFFPVLRLCILSSTVGHSLFKEKFKPDE